MVGTGIESIRRRQERERADNANRTREARKRFVSTQAVDNLAINVGGTTYPVFVPGVDDPDDTTTDRYVP